MARCKRCNKFIFIASNTGYCKDCDEAVKREAQEEKKRLEEQEKAQIEAELWRKRELEKKQKSEKRFSCIQSSSSHFNLRHGIQFGDSRDVIFAKEDLKHLGNGSNADKSIDRELFVGTIAGINNSYCEYHFYSDRLENVIYRFNNYAGDAAKNKVSYTESTVKNDFEIVHTNLCEKYGKPITNSVSKALLKLSKSYDREVIEAAGWCSSPPSVGAEVTWIVNCSDYCVGIVLFTCKHVIGSSSPIYGLYLEYIFLSESEYNSLDNVKNEL